MSRRGRSDTLERRDRVGGCQKKSQQLPNSRENVRIEGKRARASSMFRTRGNQVGSSSVGGKETSGAASSISRGGSVKTRVSNKTKNKREGGRLRAQ